MPDIVKHKRDHVLLPILMPLISILFLWSIPENYGESVTTDNYKEFGITLNFYSLGTNNPFSRLNTSTEEIKNVGSDVEKAVIIMFDRGYENQFTVAKPILDKYEFKASFFIICSFVEGSGYHKLADGSELIHAADNAMDWDQIKQLHKEGHDIESHGKEHRDLRHLSSDELNDEIAGSKECLEDYDLKPVFFQFPNNRGADNSTVLKLVSEYFDFGLAGHSRLMFLNCDGWVNHGFKTQSYKYQYDCNPFTADGAPTRTNKFAIKEWSHDREHSRLNNKNPLLAPHGSEISDMLFTEFVRVVEAQNLYNTKEGKIVAIPIIGYHFISDSTNYDTSEELFDREMKYLYDNGFKVLKISDLSYNDTQNYFYIK